MTINDINQVSNTDRLLFAEYNATDPFSGGDSAGVYTVKPYQTAIRVDASDGEVTLKLPNPADVREKTITILVTASTSNNIIVADASGVAIATCSTPVASLCFLLYSDGFNYFASDPTIAGAAGSFIN